MEHEASRREIFSVDPVPNYRHSDRGQMESDLMLPAGFEVHFEQCRRAKAFLHSETRESVVRRFPRFGEAAATAVVSVVDRFVHEPLRLGWRAMDECYVTTADFMFTEEALETGLCAGGEGKREGARGTSVQPMHDPDIRARRMQMLYEIIDSSSCRILILGCGRTRYREEPRRLVDDEDLVVLVQDGK